MYTVTGTSKTVHREGHHTQNFSYISLLIDGFSYVHVKLQVLGTHFDSVDLW